MYSGGIQYALDAKRETTLFIYASATPFDVANGTALSPFEVTTFASKITQTSSDCRIDFAWHNELYGANQPKAGQILEIKLDGVSFWVGIIQEISDYRLQTGTKSLSITARSRENTPAWKDLKRSTAIYPTATGIDYIAKQIAQAAGMQDAEIYLSVIGTTTVHSNTQLSEMSIWAMLETILQPSGLEPYIDCRGRLKTISRDTTRTADIVLSDNTRVVNVGGSRSKPTITEVRIKWLDPNLTEVAQVARQLAETALTAGFFQLQQTKDIFFSADQTQRAKNTYLVIKQSANSGILPVCSEEYAQLTPTQGKITLNTSAFVPTLATGAMITKAAAHSTPDIAPTGGGPTIPTGRRAEFAADAVLFLTMMSIGTGVYEVWGTPYDYVHGRNTTTAYNQNAKTYEINPQEIENDFVMNEQQAQGFATRELIYAYRSASSFTAKIVDDTRIEKGDIIQLSDGERLYVTDFSRDLTFGAGATLDVKGFPV